MKPDFAIIGAPKCGTSELYQRMKKHPGIHDRKPKELHYFDAAGTGNHSEDRAFIRVGIPLISNLAEYEACFDSPLLSGDATPAYLSKVLVPLAMKEDCPDCKFIVTLRDPTARLASHVRVQGERKGTHIKHTEDVRPFHNLFVWGMYAEQLRRWFLHFPRKQFLILFNEELALEPNETLARVYDFLGLQDHDENYTPFVAETSPTADGRFTQHDLDLYRRRYDPYNKDLAKLLDSPVPLTWNTV